jgi:hypothetical protein
MEGLNLEKMQSIKDDGLFGIHKPNPTYLFKKDSMLQVVWFRITVYSRLLEKKIPYWKTPVPNSICSLEINP